MATPGLQLSWSPGLPTPRSLRPRCGVSAASLASGRAGSLEMPELAQLVHMAVMINDCSSSAFHSCIRSAVGGKIGASLPIPRCWSTYRLSAQSRGKELRLIIEPLEIDTELRLQEERERDEQQQQQQQHAVGQQQQQQAQQCSISGCLSPHESLVSAVRQHITTRVHCHSLPLQRSALDRRPSPLPPVPLSGPLRLLFRMGMSGSFRRYDLSDSSRVADIDPRTHLTFLASSPHPLAVCFVDSRRYGNWDVTDSWGVRRGPDPVSEYAEFRANVIRSLSRPQFSQRLSELMLDQEFFNGIGNYLRAEICYRSGVNPFVTAREALQGLPERDDDGGCSDVLSACRDVSRESVELGSLYEPPANGLELDTAPARRRFREWKRCYHKPGMLFTTDASGRKMWHDSRWSLAATDDGQAAAASAAQTETAEPPALRPAGDESKKRSRPSKKRRQTADAHGGDVKERQSAVTRDAEAATERPEEAATAGRRRRRRRLPAPSPPDTAGAVAEESDDVVLIEPPESALDTTQSGQDDAELSSGQSRWPAVDPAVTAMKRKRKPRQRQERREAASLPHGRPRRRSARLAGWDEDNPILMDD